MRIVNLMEDMPGHPGCLFEHGLSFYIETNAHKLLMDTGASGAFIKNAQTLGIDLKQVDTVILSHGHYDHAGGILPFTEQNPSAEIYMQKTAGADYYSLRENGENYIGIDQRILHLPKLHLVDGNMRIDEELFLFSGITGRKFWPQSNMRLKYREEGTLVQDTFGHEQCLVIEQDGKRILLSGCAHNGILNILERFREIYGQAPDMVLSGFHMSKKSVYTREEAAVIENTARELALLPTVFYTGHCTGTQAYAIMKKIMGDRLRKIQLGEENHCFYEEK